MHNLLKKFAFVVLALVIASGYGCSQSTSANYPDDDIRIIIPYNAGGGFDSYIRALTPYLEKHLPQQVNVLPINTPGAGGRRGASEVYRANPDGYTIGIFNLPGVLLPQLQGMRIDYNLLELSWLATLSKDAYAYIVKSDSPINSIEDIKTLDRPVVYGATGPSSTSYIATTIVSEALEIPFEIVTGYKGSSEYILGVIRGDVDAAFANLSTVNSYIDSGDVKMIALIGLDSNQPDVQDADDLGIPEMGNINVTRMVGAPPELPDHIKTILENAFQAAMSDPGFLNWLQETGNNVHPANAEETANSLTEMAQFYEKFKHLLQ